jgi:hypothetical protein
METSRPALAMGRGLTKIWIEEDAEHELESVVITVYVAAEVNVAVGLATVDAFNPADGVHE